MAARRSGFMRMIERRPWVAQLGLIALFMAVWELAARTVVDKMFLSPPSRVFGEMERLLTTKGLTAALALTLYELAIAFVLAVVIGLVVGLAIGLSGFARRTFFPRTFPKRSGRGARTIGSGKRTGRYSSIPRIISSPSCATTRRRSSRRWKKSCCRKRSPTRRFWRPTGDICAACFAGTSARATPPAGPCWRT